VGLTNVWLQTPSDGLIRADQVVGIDAHPTPALAGKPPRWLLDVVVAGSAGSGGRESWTLGVLHRTLAQSSHPPVDATTALARLLAQLDAIDAAGVVHTVAEDAGEAGTHVRFRFAPFAAPDPGHHTDAQYL
jgi:hypothetical protein